MKVYHGIQNLEKIPGAVVTVGSFDGIHRGHLQLINAVVDIAGKSGGHSVVVTFDPHPRTLTATGQDTPALTTLDEKLILLKRLGIENVVVIHFTEEFSRISAEEFVRNILVGKIGVASLVVGYDHRFGRDQGGDVYALKEASVLYGFDVVRVNEERHYGDIVSSTVIRQALEDGDVGNASSLLGYDYFFKCRLEGSDLILGCSSTNKLLPPMGVYQVRLSCDDKCVNADLIIRDDRSMSVVKNDELPAGRDVIVTFI